MKVTFEAPANIAFVKYWGAVDLASALPANASVSMTLDHCLARTTVAHAPGGDRDEVLLAGPDGELAEAPAAFAEGVRRHLERLRGWAGVDGSFRVATRNNFPTGAGIASSAAGFAALAVAVAACLDRQPDTAELSLLARMSGSGSAARSVMGGYVRWPADDDDPESPATALAPAEHWPLCDVAGTYRRWVDATRSAIADRPAAEQRALLSENARRIYRLGAAA